MIADITAVDDETAMLLAAFERAGTAWPPQDRECLVLERMSMQVSFALELAHFGHEPVPKPTVH